MTEFLVKTTLAAGLVPPCPGATPENPLGDVTKCGEHQLLELGIKVIQFMIDIALVLAVLFFLWGGFLLLTSGGSPNQIERGKKAITGAVIGLVIVLTSVVVINTVLQFIVKPDVCKVDSKAKIISIGKIECPGLFKKNK